MAVHYFHVVCEWLFTTFTINLKYKVEKKLLSAKYGELSVKFKIPNLRGMDTLLGEATLSKKFCLPLSPLKRTILQRKEFSPLGIKFFPFRVNPFQKGLDLQEN